MNLPQNYIDDLIRRALAEDITYVDITTDTLMPDSHTSEAYYIAKDEGVLCGMDVALRVFDLAGGNVETRALFHDGDKVCKGDILATMTGSTKTLLKGERTALNLLQHMSGIATATNRCVQLVEGTRARITDTRKTLPGMRALQKYAVVVGGGRNHRFNLSDGAMLKDNHLDAYGGITPAVAALRDKIGHMSKSRWRCGTWRSCRRLWTQAVRLSCWTICPARIWQRRCRSTQGVPCWKHPAT